MDKEAIQDYVYSALSHQIRRKIVSIIGRLGTATYTDMRALNLEPGTLYFHIDILVKGQYPLVKRDQARRYTLTEIGRTAYKILEQGEDAAYWLGDRQGRLSLLSDQLAMTPVVRRLQADPWRFWFDILLFLGAYGYLSYICLLYTSPSPRD